MFDFTKFAMRIVFFSMRRFDKVETMFEELNNHNRNSETSPIVEGEFILFYFTFYCLVSSFYFLFFYVEKLMGL
jgi:hypothetical protein